MALPDREDQKPRRLVWPPQPALLFLAILIVAALPRLLLMQRHELWVDEIFSLAMATGHSLEHAPSVADATLGDYVEPAGPVPARALAKYARHEAPPAGPARVVRAVKLSDTSPPLYYLLLHGWTRVFGTGDAALRSFSLLCALACLPFLWSTARRMEGIDSAAAACAVFALLPLSIYFSTEGRMYGLVWLVAAANMWAALRLSRNGLGPAGAGVWLASAIAGLLTHYFFVFVWLAGALWLVLFPGRLRRAWTLLMAVLVIAAVAPWYVQAPAQMASSRLTDGWLHWLPPNYNPVLFYLRMPYHFFAVNGPWGGAKRSDVLFVLLWIAVGVAGLRRVRRLDGTRGWLLPALGFAGAVGGVVLIDLWNHTYAGAIERYVTPGLPAAALLAGLALGALPLRLRGALLIAIAFEGVLGFRRMHWNDGRNGQPLDDVARWLAASVAPADLVVVHSVPSGVIGLGRSLDALGGSTDSIPLVSWVEQLGRRRLPEDAERVAVGRNTAYLVRFHEVGADAPIATWLRGKHGPPLRRRWEAMIVERFDLRAEPERSDASAHARPATDRP